MAVLVSSVHEPCGDRGPVDHLEEFYEYGPFWLNWLILVACSTIV